MSMDTLAVDKPWLMLGDCLERMREIPDGSVDMIACDLPYGTTDCKWDAVIPLERLWEQYKRVVKKTGAVVLTATQPFTSVLVMSNLRGFKHEWIWHKSKCGSPFAAKYRPLAKHESVLVFCQKSAKYYPIMTEGTPYKRVRRAKNYINNCFVGFHGQDLVSTYEGNRYPSSVIAIPQKWRRQDQIHPTQKPVPLFEYLIRSYTEPGEIVLDNCFGSGTTGLACVNAGRRFIGIEQDESYFETGRRRIENAVAATQPAPQGGLFDAQAAE